MKLSKLTMPAIIAGLLLNSCGGVPPIISTPIENIDTMPLKIMTLSEQQMESWSSADLIRDTIPGMSVDRTYAELLPGRTGKEVIVAVIDSGIDIEHEDLKNVIWTNPKEIPGNGKDDDKNGYVDDIHGWNFLGDIVAENMEYVRIIRKLDSKYDGKDASSIAATDKDEFAMFSKAKAEYEKEVQQTQANIAQYNGILQQVTPAHDAMTKRFKKEDYTRKDLNGIENPTEEEQQHIAVLSQMFGFADSIPELVAQLRDGIDFFQGRMEGHFNMTKDFRGVLGDDPFDITDTNYGNNDVDGPDPKKEDSKHGTHVAGIIAAQRNNGKGTNGVAQNVKIMVLRAVPDGDEYDKDIALAIRYAVDNGAQVINTSFGKYYSPNSEWVMDAIKYAAKKDVLIVNAAGNEGLNLDGTMVYPNDQVKTGAEISDTFLTVGALNYKYGSDLVANFSNYGKSNVDVFAPGVRIYAPTPLNTYEYLQGTSMASPNVAGVAAMLRSYFPKLSAAKTKQIIMDSGLSAKTPVVLGGDPSNTDGFANISKSANMVNMYNAFILASKTK